MSALVFSLVRRKRRRLKKILGFFDAYAGGVPGGGGGTGNWILRLGVWDDTGQWDDNAIWKDAP